MARPRGIVLEAVGAELRRCAGVNPASDLCDGVVSDCVSAAGGSRERLPPLEVGAEAAGFGSLRRRQTLDGRERVGRALRVRDQVEPACLATAVACGLVHAVRRARAPEHTRYSCMETRVKLSSFLVGKRLTSENATHINF